MKEPKHPFQPVVLDADGVARFKKNQIIDFLFNTGVIDLNRIACLSFPREDRVQLAQLIGYSTDGFASLPYVNENEDREAESLARLARQDENK